MALPAESRLVSATPGIMPTITGLPDTTPELTGRFRFSALSKTSFVAMSGPLHDAAERAGHDVVDVGLGDLGLAFGGADAADVAGAVLDDGREVGLLGLLRLVDALAERLGVETPVDGLVGLGQRDL